MQLRRITGNHLALPPVVVGQRYGARALRVYSTAISRIEIETAVLSKVKGAELMYETGDRVRRAPCAQKT